MLKEFRDFIAKGNVAKMPDFAEKDPNNLLVQGEDGKFTEMGDKAGVASMATGRGGALSDFNLDGKIDLRMGPALDTLRALPAGTRIDLAFIDADKSNYGAYYEEVLARVPSGGLVLVDNTIWSGKVLAPERGDVDTNALAAFNRALAADKRVDVVMLTFRDGVTMARKR